MCPPLLLASGYGVGGVGAGNVDRRTQGGSSLARGCLGLGSGCGSWVARGAGPGSVLSAPLPFASQELFKAFARHLSHSLTQKSSPGGSGECLHHWARRHVGSTAGGSPALTLPTLTL